MNKIADNNLNCGFVKMTFVLGEQQRHKFVKIAKELKLSDGIIILGQGSVQNISFLNMLGIKSKKRELLEIIVNAERANALLNIFTEELRVDMPGHGIIYTTPVETASTLESNGILSEDLAMYKKMTVIVNRGAAEDVMEIARTKGVKGGTILRGRGTGLEIATKLFGIEIEPEKELVIMLMPENIVSTVTDALISELELNTKGKGILFVEPVIEVRGIQENAKND